MRHITAWLLTLGFIIGGVTANVLPASAKVQAAYTLAATGDTKTRDVKVTVGNNTSKQKLRITVTLVGIKVRRLTSTLQSKSTIKHTFKLNSYSMYVITLDRWTGSAWEQVATADATVAPPQVKKIQMRLFITCIRGNKTQAATLFNSGNKSVKAKFWVAKSATPEPTRAEDYHAQSSHAESLAPGQKAYVRYNGRLYAFKPHICA